jgi:hypothetical protein
MDLAQIALLSENKLDHTLSHKTAVHPTAVHPK